MISVISTAVLSVFFALMSTVQPRKDNVSTSSRATTVYIWVGGMVEKVLLEKKNALRGAKACYDMVIGLGDQQLVGSITLLAATL